MAEIEAEHLMAEHLIRLTKSIPDNHKIPPECHDFIAGAVGGSLRNSFSGFSTRRCRPEI